jgi:hypothetical protein
LRGGGRRSQRTASQHIIPVFKMLEGWSGLKQIAPQRHGTMSDRRTDSNTQQSGISHVPLTTRSHRADLEVRLAVLPARMCDVKGRERCGGGGDEEGEDEGEDEERKEEGCGSGDEGGVGALGDDGGVDVGGGGGAGEQIIVVAVVDAGFVVMGVVVMGVAAVISTCERHGSFSDLSQPRRQWQGKVEFVKRGGGSTRKARCRRSYTHRLLHAERRPDRDHPRILFSPHRRVTRPIDGREGVHASQNLPARPSSSSSSNRVAPVEVVLHHPQRNPGLG